jgi:hypothetical protein
MTLVDMMESLENEKEANEKRLGDALEETNRDLDYIRKEMGLTSDR